jgi:hypothetical protein
MGGVELRYVTGGSDMVGLILFAPKKGPPNSPLDFEPNRTRCRSLVAPGHVNDFEVRRESLRRFS